MQKKLLPTFWDNVLYIFLCIISILLVVIGAIVFFALFVWLEHYNALIAWISLAVWFVGMAIVGTYLESKY